MELFKQIPEEKKRKDFWFALGLTLLAAAVYAVTLSPGVYPGESAWLMTTCTGMVPQKLPLHPMFGAAAGLFAKIPLFSLPIRLNLMSLLCTAASVWMIYRMMSFFIYDTVIEEYSIEHAGRVSIWAGSVAAVCYLFAAPVWQAATRLQYQSFDMLLALGCVSLLVSYGKRGKAFLLILFALLWGASTAESVLFVPLAPVMLAALIYVLWKRGKLAMSRVTWVLALAVAAAAALYWASAARFFAAADADVQTFTSTSDVLFRIWKNQIAQLRYSLPRDRWLILLLTGAVPWVTSVFASFRALNNERSMSQYTLHISLLILVVADLVNADFSPWGLLSPAGRLPIASYVMTALTAGYLVAYFYLMLKVRRPKRGVRISVVTQQTGDWLGLLLTYPLAAVAVLAAIVNSFSCSGRRGAFADRCANEILDRMGGRTWLVTDGTLDPHLQILARGRKKELHLIRLQNDLDTAYLKQMGKLIEEKKLFPEESAKRMRRTLELGILPFLQDWFAMDRKVGEKVAVFGNPDFWYTAGLTPFPDALFFTGLDEKEAKTKLDGKKLYEDALAFWKSMDKILAPNTRGRKDPTTRARANLRRHMGFVATDLGVLLEDLGREEEAFKTYSYVRDTIDPENISALFNRFEMARRGAAPAKIHKEAIERELKDFLVNLKHTYPLWSLSRYYGYVRSPELFARLGWSWALSGQTGSALAGVRRAIELLPTERRMNFRQTIASIYALSEDKAKSASLYRDILKSEPENRSALLGLARLSMQEGEIEQAKGLLEKAAKSGGETRRTGGGIEWAVIHLLNNDLANARLALQETTDTQPKNLQAWALLAMIQLQQNEMSELETVTLPKMESIAGTVDNYFVQISRAEIASKRIADIRKSLPASEKSQAAFERLPEVKKMRALQQKAREGYIRAAVLRPDIPDVKNRVLQLDIAMNDQAAAELHARQILRGNRKHALANYVMGSLRLQEGRYGDAEDFLRESVSADPSAAALNDLAETLRRIQRYDQAEHYARESVRMDEKLYVAWETLASILLERGVRLDEAEKAIEKSLSLYDGDLRVRITQARIVMKRGRIEQARKLLFQIKARRDELSPFDQEAYDKLAEDLATGKRK